MSNLQIQNTTRQRFADLLGWPSDFAAWRRLIAFILRRISDIPQRLYPEIVAIFEVWQNALADLRNPTSRALLQQCANWLAAIDAITTADGPDENSAYWEKVPGLDALRKAMSALSVGAPSQRANCLFFLVDTGCRPKAIQGVTDLQHLTQT